MNLSKQLIEVWLDTVGFSEEWHYTRVMDGMVAPDIYGALRKMISQLASENKIKQTGVRGYYRRVKPLQPVKWWTADETEYYELAFPWGYEDNSSFWFEHEVSISPGDLIVIGGTSNAGKSTLALNFILENLDKHECLLMGNEFTNIDGSLSGKFKRRMLNMKPLDFWMNGSEAKFTLLPVQENFEDYVHPNKLNVIDWIELTDNFFLVARVLRDVKAKLGKGIAIAVLQKSRGKDLATGGQFTEHRADLYMTVDFHGEYESRLTLGKVKDSKKRVTGKSWAFSIVKGGAMLHNIREVVKCSSCYGFGFKKGRGRCDDCRGVGYIDK